MASWQTVSRVVVPTAVTAVMSTGLAVAVNYATGGDHSAWMWAAVSALTVGCFGASLWLAVRQTSPVAPEPTSGVDLSDVKAGGLRIRGVRAAGTGVKVRKGSFRGDVDVSDIDGGRGDASHP